MHSVCINQHVHSLSLLKYVWNISSSVILIKILKGKTSPTNKQLVLFTMFLCCSFLYMCIKDSSWQAQLATWITCGTDGITLSPHTFPHCVLHAWHPQGSSQRPDAFGCHVATLFWSCGSLSTYRPRLFQALLSHSKAVHSKGCILAGGGGMGVRWVRCGV